MVSWQPLELRLCRIQRRCEAKRRCCKNWVFGEVDVLVCTKWCFFSYKETITGDLRYLSIKLNGFGCCQTLFIKLILITN